LAFEWLGHIRNSIVFRLLLLFTILPSFFYCLPASAVFTAIAVLLVIVCCRQGRPVNSNREAACFNAKLWGNEIHAEICEKLGEGLSVKNSYNRITLLWHQRSICFMVLGGGGMDARGCHRGCGDSYHRSRP
jgi:hypothetical protein